MSEELKLDRYDVTEGGGTFKCPGGELVYYSDVEELIAEGSDLRARLAKYQDAEGRPVGVVVPHELLVRVLEPITSEQYINSKHELLEPMRLNSAHAPTTGVYSADPLACSGCASGCYRCRADTAPSAVSQEQGE